MKKFFTLVLAFCVSACAIYTLPNKVSRYNSKVIAAKSNMPLYQYVPADSSISENPVSIASYKSGDTINAVGSATYKGKMYNLFLVNGDTVAALRDDTPTTQRYAIDRQSPKFTLAKTQDMEAWSRAVSWVNQYSDMKIQTQGDLLIQTYNPIGNGVKYGYTVSKVFIGDNVEYTVECMCNNPYFYSTARQNEKELAYYIRTGDMPFRVR